jgi:hypothetical protein
MPPIGESIFVCPNNSLVGRRWFAPALSLTVHETNLLFPPATTLLALILDCSRHAGPVEREAGEWRAKHTNP